MSTALALLTLLILVVGIAAFVFFGVELHQLADAIGRHLIDDLQLQTR